MHPLRRQRLYMVLFILLCASAAAALLFYALGKNTNWFFTPTAVKHGEAPLGRTIRVGGCVVPGSVVRIPNSLQMQFAVTDGETAMKVDYTGILPDLFAEGEAAIATGVLQDNGVLQSKEVLAKHDEKYTPPEVADSLKNTMKKCH